MDQALVPVNASPLAAPTGLLSGVAALPARSKALLGIGLAALAAVVVAISLWSANGDYKVLYANLSDKDGGAIIAQLSQMNIPYKHAEGGAAILVPAEKVHDAAPEARLGRAAQGLGRRLRADGQRALRPDPVPGAAHLPARARGRADALHHRRWPRCRRRACTWRCRTRTGSSASSRSPRLGAAHAAPRPHARPRAGRRHRAPGLVERARARAQGGQRARPERRAAHRLGRRAQRRARRAAAAVRGADRERLRQAHRRPARAGGRRATTCAPRSRPRSTSRRPNRPPRSTCRTRARRRSDGAQPADDRAVGAAGTAPPAACPGAASNQPPVPATAPLNGAVPPLQAAPTGSAAGAAAGARRSPTTRSTRPCASRATPPARSSA